MPKLQIYNRNTMRIIVEKDVEPNQDGELVFQGLVPNIPMSDVVVLIDGQMAKLFPHIPQKREVVEPDQIVKTYWTFGKNYQTFDGDMDVNGIHYPKSKFSKDMNLHVEVKDGNNGKVVVFEMEQDDGEPIVLRGVVSKNEAIFNNALKRYRGGN